jgi:hypothetical protein
MKGENFLIDRLLFIQLCVFVCFVEIHCCVVIHEFAYLIAINSSLCCHD